MINYEFTITQLIVEQLPDYPNTVCNVSYAYKGTQDDGRVYTYLGSERLVTEIVEPFISFDDLTQDEVIAWLNNLWPESFWEQMQTQIANSLTAPVTSVAPLPWVPTPDPQPTGDAP